MVSVKKILPVESMDAIQQQKTQIKIKQLKQHRSRFTKTIARPIYKIFRMGARSKKRKIGTRQVPNPQYDKITKQINQLK